jgi:lipid II:glycine glycyltransferase (peptidoglycan interpeptide bridge formation enzyme)
LKLLKNTEIPQDKWLELLSKSPYSSVFQSPVFFELVNSVVGFLAEAYAVEESTEIRAVCVVTIQKEKGVKSFFSRRAIIYGGPVLFEGDKNSLNFLLNYIYKELKKKVIYIEIRNYFDYRQFHAVYKKAKWKWLNYLNIMLSLKEKKLDKVIESMKYNRRREIKLSLSEGAIYRQALDISEVEKLYLILKKLYIQKVKLPLPELEFFIALFKSTVGKVFIVLHENLIIGGAFCYYLENKTIYTMYYCGQRDYCKKIFPTHLGILAAIDFGIQNNLEYLDFMGAGLSNKEYGVRNYKQEFGGELVEYGRYLKINNILLYNLGETGLKLLKIFK